MKFRCPESSFILFEQPSDRPTRELVLVASVRRPAANVCKHEDFLPLCFWASKVEFSAEQSDQSIKVK